MQDCFRKFPEVYGSELTDDDEEEGAPAPEGGEAVAKTEEGKAQPAKEEAVSPKAVAVEAAKSESK